MVEFPEDVTIYGKLTVNGDVECYVEGGKFLVQSTGTQNAGKCEFSGNELKITSLVDDPAKIRIGSPGALSSSVSFDHIKPDGTRIEIAMIQVKPDDTDSIEMGPEIRVWAKRKGIDGDCAMWPPIVIVPEANGKPKVYIDDPEFTLGAHAPAGQNPAIVSLTNLSGSVSAFTPGDGTWLTAINAQQDTEVVADIPATGTSLEIEMRRTQSGGTQPYVYVYVDDVLVINSYRPASSTSPFTLTTPVQSCGLRRVKVRTSAQGGTCEIGGIRIV